MSVVTPLRTDLDRADLDRALLEMLEALIARSPLFADLRARGEADDLVQDTLLAVSRRMQRGGVDDPFAYATRVVQNLARRAYARPRRELASPLADIEAAGPQCDVADQVEQRFELAEVLDMVRAVTAVVNDLAPADVELVRAELRREDQVALARRLGMSRTTFYRRKREAVCGFVSAVARDARTRPCPDRLHALLAAAGGSGFAGARRAREHAAGCPGCRETLRHLTAARHGLAILTPLPAVGIAPGDTVVDRLAAGTHALAEWVRGLVVRAPDPTAALPATKTAAAAVAAACIGVGGTTYCAVDGVPRPVRDALGMGHVVRHPTRSAGQARSTPGRALPVGARASQPGPNVRTAHDTSRIPQPVAAKRAAVRRVAEFATAGRRSGGSASREFGHETRRAHARRARAAEFAAPAARTATAAAAAAPSAPAPPASGSSSQEFGGTGGGSGGSGEFG